MPKKQSSDLLKFRLPSVEWCLNNIVKSYPARNIAELAGAVKLAKTCCEAYVKVIAKSNIKDAIEDVLGQDIESYIKQCEARSNDDNELGEVLNKELECYMHLLLLLHPQLPPDKEEEEFRS